MVTNAFTEMDYAESVMSPVDTLSPRGSMHMNEDLSINDVFEAIHMADPTWPLAETGPGTGAGVATGTGDGAGPGVEMCAVAGGAGRSAPRVRIVEQPHPRALRFRYECEGRSAGSIPGIHSTPEHKTFPTIEVLGYRGPATVVVSCVTADEPYRPHPHNLVGERARCEQGVCKVRVDLQESPLVSFSNIGIQCVKRKDIADALKVREKLLVDPFKTGYSHKSQPQSIDLNVVRLCFQVLIPDERFGTVALPPAVSEKVYDKKAVSELAIMKVSHCSGPVAGGQEMILLCEKVSREDVEVVFYECSARGAVTWEAAAEVTMVHRLVAVVCRLPAYRHAASPHHHQVFMQLRRRSDNERSQPVPFEYIPHRTETTYLQSKGMKRLSPFLQSPFNSEQMFSTEQKLFKLEPRERTPSISSPKQFPLEPNVNPTPEWLQEVDNVMKSLRPPAPGPAPALARLYSKPLRTFPADAHSFVNLTLGASTPAPAPPAAPAPAPAAGLPPQFAPGPSSLHYSQAGHHASEQLNLHLDQVNVTQIGLHQLESDSSLCNILSQDAQALLNTDLSLPSLPSLPSVDFKDFV